MSKCRFLQQPQTYGMTWAWIRFKTIRFNVVRSLSQLNLLKLDASKHICLQLLFHHKHSAVLWSNVDGFLSPIYDYAKWFSQRTRIWQIRWCPPSCIGFLQHNDLSDSDTAWFRVGWGWLAAAPLRVYTMFSLFVWKCAKRERKKQSIIRFQKTEITKTITISYS